MNKNRNKIAAMIIVGSLVVSYVPRGVYAEEMSRGESKVEKKVDGVKRNEESDANIEDVGQNSNQQSNTHGCFKVTDKDDTCEVNYNQTDNKLTISGAGKVTISTPNNDENNKSTAQIEVESGFDGTINLNGVNITNGNESPFLIKGEESPTNLTINIMKKSSNIFIPTNEVNAGIELSGEKANITITAEGEESEWGLLKADSKRGAGIGSGNEAKCGNITISGGKIEATSSNGAGIGSGRGDSAKCGNITISEGEIKATSSSGAGIGSGEAYKKKTAECGAITISGGKIEAISSNGAGIGSGKHSSSCGNITISGEKIEAISSEGAGIGSGNNGYCGNITINGGSVTATSSNGAGIGSGIIYAGCGTITINGGSVKASRISDEPKDENGNIVYLVKLEGKDNVTNVKVDEKDYNVSHPNDDNSLYLYMPIGTHIIATNEASYEAKVYKDKDAEVKETDIISIDKTTLNFGEKNGIYSTDNLSQNITITNRGSKKATLKELADVEKYNVTLPANKEIEPGQTATITITPKEGLDVGEYDEEITIKTEREATVKLDVKFKVNEVLTVSLSAKDTSIIEGKSTTLTANATGGSGSYTYNWYVNNSEETSLKGNEVNVSPNETTTYKVEVSDGIETKTAIVTVNVTPATYTIKAEPESLDFGGKEEGYKIDKLSKDVKITNTGNTKVTLKDLTNTKYDVVLPTNKEIESGQTATITITPKKDLAVGEHNEAITIATDQGSSVTVNAKFKVNSSYVPSKPSKPEQKPEEKPEEKPGIGVEVEVVDKIAGEDRYETSVDISQKVFPSKSDKVYLVSGEKFPDALSLAALTGKGDGPILLINDKNIDKIIAEIDRLDAKEIVFIGGNSISDANEAKIHKFAKENSSVVDAFVGEDRYETAVKVAEQTISKYGNKGKVIIADGRNYPDAVSIASYAAKEGIPVILVNGNKVPDVVKNFLNKYKINSAIIVGGDKAVGKDVEKLFKSVDRVAGADRYETSKKIAEKFFAGSKTIFVASGESFADSLSVSYYAGAKNAPILLTKANSLDNDTREYLEKNKDKDYIIVGGDKAVNPDLFK